MHSFQLLAEKFSLQFEQPHFPSETVGIYEAGHYFLKLGGKRVRPVLCLMGNELFDEIRPDAMPVAIAIELFHNFTLVHDDIMDKAPLRRGLETVHRKFGENTALLAGDVMLVAAYDYLNKVSNSYLHRVMQLFNQTARQVCEGQQMDMDFEARNGVAFDDYLRMIELKTSVLIAASLKMGSILGGAGERNQNLLYEFGRKLGIAFQVQDDYLDAFGDSEKFGKQIGGDILSNKKTFLLIYALEHADPAAKKELLRLQRESPEDKVARTLDIFRTAGADRWALQLKDKYLDEALQFLEDIAVLSRRKEPLRELAQFLVQRDH
ncbi:MAG TPA: polyprenyl synthetase family protein [Chitinophagaceae bacterium]|nr:polyprenyl synthetase family protein [Chitinophagaceae bacterium]